MSAVRNLREFTTDRHHVVDDVPFGGGPGMVMKPEPFFAAMAAMEAERGRPGRGGAADARPAGDSRRPRRCGSPGVERDSPALRSIRRRGRAGEGALGDRRTVHRRLRALGRGIAGAGRGRCGGAAGSRASSATSSQWKSDSFVRGLLDYPHYTRPAEYAGQRRAGRAAVGPPRRDSAMAAAAGAAAHLGDGGPTCSSRRSWMKKSRRGCGRGRPCRHRRSEREGSQQS